MQTFRHGLSRRSCGPRYSGGIVVCGDELLVAARSHGTHHSIRGTGKVPRGLNMT